MTDYRAPLDDIRFVLNHQLALPDSWSRLGLDEVDPDTAGAILSEAGKICEEVIAPLNREADEQGCKLEDGIVKAAEGFAEAYQTFCEGGWCALSGNPEYGGMGMPKSLVSSVEEMVQGGCMAFGLAPMLTAGACLAINAHGSNELKETYLPKMYTGEWAGAMDLTEANAGTDLGQVRAKAEPLGDGSYAITGTKIFITWGDHELAENIIHLVLARLPDAPAGVRGISMFLVPKFIPNENGENGERNPVFCGSIEKKMGIKASATCVMNYDGAKGWLVGPENKGLACMFTMMNYERLIVGIQAVGAAEVSYQNAVAYSRERLQSRAPSGPKYPDQVADPLIVLPDIRRMLLTMRAMVEGGRAFYIYVANWLDIVKFGSDEVEKALAEKRVALLTPIAKAFLTDTCFDVAVMGQQVYGGHGYVREWGQEQLVRDIRITQIYEGTNGVQALDLIGRKTVACKGELAESFCQEVELYLEKEAFNSPFKGLMQSSLTLLRETTTALIEKASGDPNHIGAAAVDYLNLFGYVCYAYMWLRASTEALNAEGDFTPAFLEAKHHTATFYFERLLPITNTFACRVILPSGSVMAMADDLF